MTRDELLAMLRHAARHNNLHHVAGLAEIHALTRVGISDEEFRAKTIEIIDAVQQVEEEIDAAPLAGGTK